MTSFVAASAVVTGANPTVAVPTGFAAGDLLIINVTSNNSATSTPSGWTAVATQVGSQSITVFWKYAITGQTSVALTNASATTKAVMLAYRSAVGFEIVPAFTTGTGTSATPNNVTTTQTNGYIVRIYADVSGAAATWTAPASTTSRVNSASTTTVQGLLIVDELQAAIGVTTTRTATISTSRTWAAISIAITTRTNNIYWVGGTGNWNGATVWAGTSGGIGGIPGPGASENAIFDANSNNTNAGASYTCNIGAVIFGVASWQAENPSAGVLTFTGSGSTVTSRDITFQSDVVVSCSNSLNTNGTIITNGVNFTSFSQIGMIGGTTILGGAFTCGTITFYAISGSNLNLNGYTLNANAVSFTSGTGARTLNISNSILNLTASGTVFNAGSTNITITSTNSTINFTSNAVTAKTFAGGGYTYNNLNFAGSATATYTITGANTFTGTISSVKTVPFTIVFPASTTTTVGNWTANGNPKKMLAIQSSTNGTQATLTKSGGGTIAIDQAIIRDIAVTPSSTWDATNSVSIANNSGWNSIKNGFLFSLF